MAIEFLEMRMAPAGLLSLMQDGTATGGKSGMMEIDISALTDNASPTAHVGLASATLAVTYPTGVYNFPVGGSQATSDVTLGTVETGGTANWNLSANSTQDGNLLISITAKAGHTISTTTGGSLAIINFPILLNPSSPATETINVVSAVGSTHTSIVGSNGTYTTASLGLPASGTMTIQPGVAQKISLQTPQNISGEPNVTINQAAPGLLTGATDPQSLPMEVNSINGTAYTAGTPDTLPSGAVLTVNMDGSFSYVPPNNYVGVDTFTYTANDSNNNGSNTATANVTLMPTIHLSPSTFSGHPGDKVSVQVILDNADQGTTGGLASFNLALTYTPFTLDIPTISITPGPAFPGSWTFTANTYDTTVTPASGYPGVIGYAGFGSGTGTDVIHGTNILLATIDVTLGPVPTQSIPLQLVPEATTPGGNPATSVTGPSGSFAINPAPSNTFINGVDTQISLTGTATALTVTPNTLASAAQGQAYSQTIKASGGTGPYTFASSGSLPTGLTLNLSTGVLSGTPTASGNYPFTVYAADSTGNEGSQAYSLTVTGAGAIEISPTSLPNWTVNQAYTQTVSASGGIGAPYTFTLTSGTLPTGLTLASNGVLSGTPTATGSYTFTVQANDANPTPDVGSQQYTVVINAAPTITTTKLPNWTQGQAYSQTIAVTGGTTPIVFSNSGTLPPGVTLNTSTGVLSGTPTAAGSYNFSIIANDAATASSTQPFTVVIAAPVSITTTSLPSSTVNSSYSQTINATGGTGTLTFSLTNGTLPTGLALSSTGVLSGTTTATGSYNFTVTATDTIGASGTQSYTVNVTGGFSITTTSLPNGSVNTAYSQTISTSGGTGTVTFNTSAGTLPTGLTLNSSTGVLSGTPTAAGSFNFTVQATDSASHTATQAYSVTISAAFSISPTSLPNGDVNLAYNQTISASGGTAPVTFSTSAGTLPTGLTLNSSTGVLSGTPSAAGNYNFTIQAADSAAPAHTTTQAYSVTINAAVAITTTSLPNGTQGTAYSQTVAVSGGQTPYTFSTSAGTLPTGLTLNSSTGVISGTPTSATAFSFTVQAKDSLGGTATQAYNVTIASNLAITNTTLPGGTTGTAYSQTVAVTGGTSPYTFNTTSGTLPTGLTLNASTGVISGTPTAAGSYNFTVTVTDSSTPKNTTTQSYSVTIATAFAITTTSLPNGAVNAAYSQTINVAGGTAPFTFTTSAGTLPTGLTLNSSTGVLSGTPTTAGSYNFTIQAADSASHTATQSYTVDITAGFAITTTSLPKGDVNLAYSQTISTAGGTGTVTFTSSSGTVPTGLTLSSTGVLSGTPTAAGSYNFTIQATDSASHTATQAYTVVINPAISVSPTAMPEGDVGVAYLQTVSATGGNGTPYTFSSTGTLPAGVTLNPSTGVLSGTPTASALYSFVIDATDSLGGVGSQSYSVNIHARVQITTTSLPNGSTGTAYNQTISVTGGNGNNTFTTSSGTLPTGVTLNNSTGVLSGTPTAQGSFAFTIQAADSLGSTDTHNYTVQITTSVAITLSPTTLPNGDDGLAYSQTISATGGTGPYSFTTSAGTLPTGLTLSSTGVLAGTPSASGTYNFTIKATDSTSSSGTQDYTVTINPQVTITTTSLPNPALSTAYSQTIVATGGQTPYTFSVGTGALPTGLTLNTGTGVVSGTPTAPGTFTFSVTATDALGGTGNQSYTLTVASVFGISPTNLPNGVLSTAYSQTLTASGGTGTVTFSVSAGTLPTGITLSPSGTSSAVLSGTPTAAGSYTFTIQATDSATPTPHTTSQSYTVVVSSSGSVAITLPSGLGGDVNHPITNFTVSVGALQDSSGHTGLASATIVITFPTGVFNFPIGGSQATTDVSLGSIPLAHGGTAKWNLAANSPADGTLVISLSAAVGGSITSTDSGSLVNITFPVKLIPSTDTPETINMVSASGSSHTQIVSGSGGAYSNGSTGLNLPQSTTVTIHPSVATVTVVTPQSYTTEANVTFNGAAPGLLQGATGNLQPLTVKHINGAVYTPGTPLTLPSGAVLTVNSDGSFTYVPPTGLVGTDSFTFTATDTGGNVSNTGTVNFTLVPTIHLSPPTVTGKTGDTVTESVFLDNADQGTTGGLASFNLALTYTPFTMTVTSITPGTAFPGSWTFTSNFYNGNTASPAGTPGVIGYAGFGSGTGTDVIHGTNILLATITFTIDNPANQVVPLNIVPLVMTPTGNASTSITGPSGAFTINPALSDSFINGVDAKITISNTTSTGPLTVSPTSLPAGSTTAAYLQTISATGGTGPYNFVATGNVPPGLTLNLTSGVLSGTPTTNGAYSFTVYAGDKNGLEGSQNYTVIIGTALAISPTSLPNGSTTAAYNQTISVTGGTAPYTFSTSSGTLPTGLTLNASTGVLSGTPTTAGNYSFTIGVADSSSPQLTGSQAYTVTITSQVKITTTSLPNGALTQPYSQTIVVTGGTTPYTFSTSAGTLPTGLTLNSSTGVISGTPTTTTGSPFSFTIQVADSSTPAQTTTQSYTVTITQPVVTLTLSPTVLPNGDDSLAYSQTISATGGTGPYTFSTSAGTLPTGLTLNSSTGVISGTPSATGTFNFTIKATDSVTPTPDTGTQSYTVTINPEVTITTTSLPNGPVNVAYTQTIAVTGGQTPYTFSTSAGTLPTGVTLNTSTGVLSGTPTAAGAFSFTISAKDSLGQSASQAYNVTITVSTPLAITPTSLPNGDVNLAYSQTISATGGTAPYTFTTSAGTLPTGLTLNSSTGVLSGTPTASGSFNFTVKATDSAATPNTGTQAYTVVINAAVAITTTSLPGGTQGTAYSQTVAVSGGQTPYTFSTTAGTLPTGLTLNSSTGVISGTPTSATAFSFTVQAKDSLGGTATQAYNVTIASNLKITTTNLPNGSVGASYTQTVAVTGGTSPYTFSTSTGTLPTGLTLNASTGVISGTTTTAGTYNFTVQVTDSSTPKDTATQAYTVDVTTGLSISPTVVPNGDVGVAYSQTFTASGATGAVTWSAPLGLPPGLTLTGSTGVLSGTPTNAGAFQFTIMATDSAAPPQTASHVYTIVINAAVSITTTSLPNGTQGAAYNQTISVTGGAGVPYTFATSAGTLPTGLTLNTSTGVISGTPTSAQAFSFTVTAHDSLGSSDSHSYTVTIASNLAITTTSLPGGSTTSPYNQTIVVTGGTTPYTYSTTTGTLPTGLTLNASTGAITGTPTAGGAFNFTVQVTDSSTPKDTASQAYSVTITTGATPVTIATTALPNGALNAAYTQTISTTGGTAPITFTTSSGTLPTGLTLNSSTGVISGTATATGSFTFTIKATDSATTPTTDSKTYTVSISAGVSIQTTSLPATDVNSFYNQTISVTGGQTPYTFSSTGTLPPGVTLNSSTGVVTGIPSTPGTFSFVVTVKDSSSPQTSDSHNYSVTVNAPLAISTTSLPNGSVGSAYSQTIVATGGSATYTFTKSAGTLPTGLTLNSSTGVVSGTPTATGTYNLIVTVTDGLGGSASQNYTIAVNSTISILTTALPNGEQGAAYSQTISATGGSAVYTFSTSAGTLPTGLTLNSSTGVLSGTPTATGAFSFTVKATDSLGATATQPYNVTITPGVSVTTTSLPNGDVGTFYNSTVAATGGTTPYSFHSLGTLPAGLTLTSSGVLTGIPSTAGSYTFTVIVTDSLGGSANSPQPYTVTINAPVAITTTSLPNTSVGASYSQTISATGGNAAYTFTKTGGTLPTGLTLNSSTGVLSGTASAAGTYSFIVTVNDGLGGSASQNYAVTVNAGVVITTTSLPNGQVGTPYSQTIVATGGSASYTFTTTSGTLPTGLTLNGSTGVISGTPTAANTFSFTIKATDTLSNSASQSYTVTITQGTPVTLSLTPTSVPGTDVGAAYSQTISTTNGTAPFTFTTSAGTLPTGLTLSSTGVLSGSATATGTFSFTIKGTDSLGDTGTQNYSITVSSAITITTTSLSAGDVGAAYSQIISATGGTGTLTFAKTSGTLPAGLTLSSTGVLSGVPSASGSFSFVVTASDGVGGSASHNYSVTINPAVAITTTSLPNTDVGATYSQTITASGGDATYTFTKTAGTLPTGLTLSSTGVLSGSATATGTFTFIVTANDSLGGSASQNYSILVNPAISITTTSLSGGDVGLAYNQTISATGGNATYTFSTSAGTLPTGLTLNSSTGAITGTPTAQGSFNFTVKAADSLGGSATQSYAVTINPAVTITTTSLTNGAVGVAYSQTVSATGGTAPLTYKTTAGTLPTGLTLNSGTGAITGTPTTGGTFNFTIGVNDTLGSSASQSYTVTVSSTVLTLTPTVLPNGDDNAAYSQTINAGGATGAVTFSSSGTLPTGLTLNGSTGVISGTPSATGTFNFTVSATDSASHSGSQAYTVTINPEVAITTASLPNTDVGLAYNQTIHVTGGNAAYTFSSSGAFPAFLTLNSSTGVLTGTANATGSFSFTITVHDGLGGSAMQGYTITVNPAVAITNPTLGNGDAGAPYSQTVNVTGGSGVYTITKTSGTLPAGLTLNSSTGVLSGIPSTQGNYSFIVTASDNLGGSTTQAYSVTINPPVAITTSSLPNTDVGLAYNQTIVATGGSATYTFTRTGGTLPTGLTLNSSNGVISGSATTQGTYNFIITANDNLGGSASMNYTVVVNQAVSILTSSLPNGAINTAYSQTISAAGGTGTYTFTRTSGTLPTGLTLNSSTGVVSGTPTAAGPFTFTVSATDTLGGSASQSYTVTITVPVIGLTLSPSTLPNGDDGLAYSQTVSATGGTAPYTFSTSAGTLPTGLTLNSSTGVISGTPSATGTFSFTIKATDSAATPNTGTQSYTVTINPEVTITTTSLPPGNTNVAYSQTIGVTGGQTPYTFTKSFGTLPPGLTLNSSTGVVSGTPTTANSYNFTITVNDALGGSASNNYLLTIMIPTTPVLSPTTLPGGDVGLAYNQTISATGGTTPFTFSSTGTLPTGLTLNSSTGVLSGTPTAQGSFSFTITATDSASPSHSGSQAYTVVIAPAITLSPPVLPSGTQGSTYPTTTITATGGTGTKTFAVTAGGLPTGLTLATTGVLSGTPTAAGSYNFTITATDTIGGKGSQSYTVTISGPVVGAIYVDPSFVGTGDPATDPGLGLTIGVNAFSTITAGLAHVSSGGTLVIFGGTYAEPSVNFNVTGGTTVDIATNPADTPVTPTVTISNAVTLGTNTSFSLAGVATGTGTSHAANLTFGSTVDGPGSLSVTGSATLTFNGQVGNFAPLPSLTDSAATTFGTGGTLVVTSGDQTYNSPVTLSATNTTFNVGGTHSAFNDGVIGTASTGLTKNGTGTLTMAGPNGNTYTGPTIVNAGTLNLNEPGGPGFQAIVGDLQITGTGSVVDQNLDEIADTTNVTMAGSGNLTLSAGITETIGTLASTANTTTVTLQNGSNLITGGGGSTVFAGTISGTGELTKTGTSTDFTLSGNNTYTGPTVISQGTLTINGTLQPAPSTVNLDDPSAVLNGSGTVLRGVVITSTGGGSQISGSLTITNANGTGIDVQSGASDSTIKGVTVTGNNIGILAEPGAGNDLTITGTHITSNMQGLELLNGCITADNNVIGGASGKGNNIGVYIPAVNPNNSSLPVNPGLTLQFNNISWNTVGLQNSSSMAANAQFNWWGNAAGPGPVDGLGRNPIIGLSPGNYTPFATSPTSVGTNPSGSNFTQGVGSDGNVYVVGTQGADNITATVDPVNPNIIHVTVTNASGTTRTDYTRGGSTNRLIIYSLGSSATGSTHDTITVSGSWDAEIHSGPGNNRITTLGTGNDVIFGGGNDIINADTSGNNVIVEGQSTGKTGTPSAPQMSGGSGANIYIAGGLDCATSSSASGLFDYTTLRAIDDAWAAGTMGGEADAMGPITSNLFNAANTPGAIEVGTARAIINAGTGKSWFVVLGDSNPTASSPNADFVSGSTASPSFRQGIQ